MIPQNLLTKYNTAAKLCGQVFINIKNKIDLNNVINMDISQLCIEADLFIASELAKVYKKDIKNADPVCISLDNVVYNANYKNKVLLQPSLVKIEVTICISDAIAVLCETFQLLPNTVSTKVLTFLDTLQIQIIDKINEFKKLEIENPGNPEFTLTNDELRILIESECTKHDVFPIENCISYQHSLTPGLLVNADSNYIILNYNKKYDQNDCLLGLENLCFDIEKDSVFTFNISVACDDTIKIKQTESGMYSFNDNVYNLKLQASRDFYRQYRSKHGYSKFDMSTAALKAKLGIIECLKHGTLDTHFVNCTTTPIYTKKFTVIIRDNDCYMLKYA